MDREFRIRGTLAAGSPIRHILVATDFGSSSNAAIGYGVALARHFGATLTLVHVWRPARDRGELVDGSDAQQEQAARQALARALARTRRRLPEAEAVFRVGSSTAELLTAIEHGTPDLVIVGARGRGSREQVLLGSVAERLSRLSPAPVLVVRDRGQRTHWFRDWYAAHAAGASRSGLNH